MWDFENNHDVIGLGNGFLDMTSREQAVKEKINQTPSELKTFSLEKTTNKIKRQEYINNSYNLIITKT